MQLKRTSKRTHEHYNDNCLSFPDFQIFDFTLTQVPHIGFFARYQYLSILEIQWYRQFLITEHYDSYRSNKLHELLALE